MKKLLVIIGCSSAMAAPIVKEANTLMQKDVLLIGRQPNPKIKGEFVEFDVCNELPERLLSILEKYTHIEIFWLVGMKFGNIDEVLKVNFLAPVKMYEELVTKWDDKKINFIVFSSQGDIHGGLHYSSYNSSKSALSNYFMPKIYMNHVNVKVFLVKPWIFQSKMTNKNVLYCNKAKLAKYVVRKVNENKNIIIYPKWTYLTVRILNFLFPLKIYKLISYLSR